jgi:hypothetical protein
MARYFTVEEANALLPRLKPLVAELQQTHELVLTLRSRVQSVLEKSEAGSGSAAASRLAMAFMRLEDLVQQINQLGVEVKDVNSGLCDFLAVYKGREIYLCWRLGEEQVEWWHDLHTGFRGRRHVDQLSL